jgi:hypothetical protein
MALTPITRHFGEAIVSLIPALWGKPVVAALLHSYVAQIQRLEDDAWEVLGAFDVRTCDATRLAILGKVVGQANFGWSTETYRSVIMAKIAVNRSKGREDDLLRVISLAAGVTIGVGITALGFATLYVTLPGAITDDQLEALLFLLPKTRSAGVQLQLLASGSTDPDEIFLWGDTWATTENWAGAFVL